MMRSAPVPAAGPFTDCSISFFRFRSHFSSGMPNQADDEQITDAEGDACLSLYLGAGCTEIRSQMDVRVRYLQQALQLGHQRPHGAAGPAIGLRHGSRVLPGKDHAQTQGSIRIRRRVEPAPASGPPQVRQRQRTSSKLRGFSRCLAGFFSSCASPLAFFLLLGSFALSPSFPAGAAAGCGPDRL